MSASGNTPQASAVGGRGSNACPWPPTPPTQSVGPSVRLSACFAYEVDSVPAGGSY